MFSFSTKGDYDRLEKYLKTIESGEIYDNLDKYGRKGVNALASATPVRTGLTANSWNYRVIKSRTHPGVEWYNTNAVAGTSVAILIQYGHGTGTGGYVQGLDYINPAIRPVFDEIVDDIWRQVKGK